MTTSNQNNPQWIINTPQIQTKSHVGFVYIILNHTSDKFYIGKKLFTKNWQSYTGSSKTLNQDIKNGHQISKHIVHLCSNKSEMTFVELYLQIITNALLSSDSYNEYVHVRLSTKHLDIDLGKIEKTVRRIISRSST